jgi:TldD protein
MANVSLAPAPGPRRGGGDSGDRDGDGPTTADLIAGVDRGIYIMGDKSWSIDMQRYNFQFTGQRFFKIEDGRLVGQVKDVAYQATTTEFWGAMEAVGGASTYVLGGAFNCGKGQPGQVAPVSHGCPSALVRRVRVLNAREEAGR